MEGLGGQWGEWHTPCNHACSQGLFRPPCSISFSREVVKLLAGKSVPVKALVRDLSKAVSHLLMMNTVRGFS